MYDLFKDKYIDAEIDQADLLPWEDMQENRYGFVYIKNPNYLIDSDDKYIIRKPTPEERREIVINTVIQHSGKRFAVSDLAYKLGVSERAMQTLLRQLKKEGLIEIIPTYNKSGKQKRNAYKYIGPPCKKYGSGLTLQLLYSTKQDVGFRGWAWKEHEFFHNKVWHSIYPLCKEKFKCRVARRKYLERNNLPLTVPEDIRYLVLRYCYWKGPQNLLWEQRDRGCVHSRDGTIKIPIEPLERSETVPFCGYTLSVKISGTKDNPIITISNAETKELWGEFTWFEENIIQGGTKTDEDILEQFFILVDFATK